MPRLDAVKPRLTPLAEKAAALAAAALAMPPT